MKKSKINRGLTSRRGISEGFYADERFPRFVDKAMILASLPVVLL
jgi:hypothetical protein